MEDILNFLAEINSLKKVERYSNKPPRFRDSVAEHCMQMIIMADMLIQHFKLDLDFSKVVRYIYLHDLGEIGMQKDICAYSPNKPVDRKTKKESEKIVAHRFFHKHNRESYKLVYDDYNAQCDKESKFVNLLDKTEPLIFALSNGYRNFMKYEPYEFTVNYPNKALELYPEITEFVNSIKLRMTEIYKTVSES